jgi:4-amino-4-deoxy-L-arabinose transferase-like glycosyltransferase
VIARAAGRIDDYVRGHPWSVDVALLVLLTACAAALRLTLLGDIPYGVHADEAQVGTDAHRILRDGWIGVYTHAALGQPAGHAYLTTPSIWLLGDTAFALRLPLALVGLAAVPLLYLLVRVLSDRLEAFFAAALLTISYWHLFYSRVAHWSISYGTVVLAVLLCFALGMRTGRRAWFIASGALLGLGVYTYNIYPVAVAAVAVFVAIITLMRYRHALRLWLARLGLMAGAALIVALPMIWYVSDPDAYYWKHIDNYSEVDVTKSPEFKQADAWGKLKLIGTQARTFVEAYTIDGKPDYVDGNGLRPMFDVPTLLLLAGGLMLAVRRRKEPMVIAALCCFVIIPLPAVLQRGSIMRQPLAAAPFAMYLAALPLAALVRATRKRSLETRVLAVAGIGAVLALIAAMTVKDYFWEWRRDAHPRLVYFSQMTTASDYMRRLPPNAYVLFFSERASINLETRQYLAPDVKGEDRSYEFSSYGGITDIPPHDGPTSFVLLGNYGTLLATLRQRYPGGVRRTFVRDGKTEFFAYELPAEAAPAR